MSWSEKYKKSINCDQPKGFSQKAHCAGRKKRKNEMNENLKEVIMEILTEGVDDPGILKCVFMAGGPGSGKSYTAKEIFGVGKGLTSSFSVGGLKLVNSDTAFEKGLKDNGINPKDLGKIEKEDPELWDKITGKDSIRSKAKELTKKQQNFYEAGRLGMIIDGTGDEVQKIKKKKQHAEKLGYDCYMVFVNTSLEVALERNRNRDRVLPDDLVTDIWKACQNNLGAFQTIFSGNMVIVDNTVYKPINKVVQKAINAFLRKPIYNRIGKKWIETARALKRARLIKAGKEIKGTSVNESMKPSQVRSAISKVKKGLMKKWKQKGGYENFGQKELSQMKDKFDYNPYGSSDERQIAKMLDGFDNWAMNYDGNMREAYIVTYAKKKGEKPASAAFQLRGSALSFEKDLKKDGYITMVTQKKVKGIDESVNEARRSVVHKAAKNGSFPVSLVVVKNGKVIDQQLVNTPEVVPAAFNVIQSKHKGATVHIEDKTGKRLFSEDVNEAKTYKKGDKLKIKLPNGKKFDVVFDSYSRTKGVGMGKFKDGSGEYDIKPFNLDTIVESVNEAELKLGVRYVNNQGKEGFIQTGGSKNPKDWFWYDGKTKHPYDKVKKELKPSKDQKKTGFGDYLKQGGRIWDNVNPTNEVVKTTSLKRYKELKKKGISVKLVTKADFNESVNEGKIQKFDDVHIKSKNLTGMVYAIKGNDVVVKTLKKGLVKTKLDDLKKIYSDSVEKRFNLFMEENVPTDPGKWSYYKSQAKKKFDVYPSAYANGWAAKQYKAAGGGWKTKKD